MGICVVGVQIGWTRELCTGVSSNFCQVRTNVNPAQLKTVGRLPAKCVSNSTSEGHIHLSLVYNVLSLGLISMASGKTKSIIRQVDIATSVRKKSSTRERADIVVYAQLQEAIRIRAGRC